MSEINVVPYIDVMLVLLVIFMITAPLLTQGVKVDLPEVASQPIPYEDNEPVIINVDKDGNFFINYGENKDQPIPPVDLINRVQALIITNEKNNLKPPPFLVGGDQSASYGRVVELMALLQRAGVTSVGMITEPPEK